VSRDAVDTSVVVAALLGWHEDHAPARAALEAGLAAGRLIVPAPVPVEAYSVMTRLPAPHRISPADAVALLGDTFRDVTVIALEPKEIWTLLAWLDERKIAGGRAYDGHILACSKKGRARRLFTLNARDFLAFDEPGIEIVRPGE
jgi:predicted nucleic acid-binding protein